MRSRNEIEKEMHPYNCSGSSDRISLVIVELLLDVREILSNLPINIEVINKIKK